MIGRWGLIEWPARSPSLTPADYFLWGHLKEKVYGQKLKALEYLKTAITVQLQKICQDLCERVHGNFRKRQTLSLTPHGDHFE